MIDRDVHVAVLGVSVALMWIFLTGNKCDSFQPFCEVSNAYSKNAERTTALVGIPERKTKSRGEGVYSLLPREATTVMKFAA